MNDSVAPKPTLGNGKVCYLEIPALDINASAAFYKNIFGWNIRQRGDGNISFDDGVGEVSGTWVLGRKASTDAGLLIYIMVDSVAAIIDAIIANGGTIVQPNARAPAFARKCRRERSPAEALLRLWLFITLSFRRFWTVFGYWSRILAMRDVYGSGAGD